jgi:hypothetical protein
MIRIKNFNLYAVILKKNVILYIYGQAMCRLLMKGVWAFS